jgi:hypothetical protein
MDPIFYNHIITVTEHETGLLDRKKRYKFLIYPLTFVPLDVFVLST